MKIVYRHQRPQAVLYVRATGPYATGANAAWRILGRWLDGRNARPLMRVSYGLFRDDPRRTAADILRYDACIPLAGLEADEATGIKRHMMPGGAYGVHTYVGTLEGTGPLISELYRKEMPARGLTVDVERPFVAVYLTDPTVTPTIFRRSELCVPVAPLPMLHAGNDEMTASYATVARIRGISFEPRLDLPDAGRQVA